MDASARDWMGTEIEIGQTVAYCGADVFGWPQAIVQGVSDEGVSLAFENGVQRTVRPEQVVVLDKEA